MRAKTDRVRFIGSMGFAALILCVASVYRVLARILRPRIDRGPSEVAEYLRDFLAGADGLWDWDDFCSRPIIDTDLDTIRTTAAAVSTPLTPEGMSVLQRLLDEAEFAAVEAELRD